MNHRAKPVTECAPSARSYARRTPVEHAGRDKELSFRLLAGDDLAVTEHRAKPVTECAPGARSYARRTPVEHAGRSPKGIAS